MPPHARARQLLRRARARVVRRFPMTIQVVDRRADQSTTHPLRLKIDPGSRTTGLALVSEETATVVWAAELTHRSTAIRDTLLARRAFRCQRRQAPRGYPTRYRPARFANRRRPAGWLAPSLRSRVDHILTWYRRLAQRGPIQAISVELIRFDPQALVDPEIRGVEYQQGDLLGYEVREYLLEKWGRTCAYCGATGVPLQVEHIVPRTRGGSDRVSNLTLACNPCNQRKGAQTAVEARVLSGSKQGRYVGRVAVRASGSFNITTATGTVHGLHQRFVRVLTNRGAWPTPIGGARLLLGVGLAVLVSRCAIPPAWGEAQCLEEHA